MRVWVAVLLWCRWIPVLLFALPLSWLLRLTRSLRAALSPSRTVPFSRHVARVAAVQSQVRSASGALHSARPLLSMTTMRRAAYKRSQRGAVDLSALCDVVALEDGAGVHTVAVEPMVTIKQLTAFLSPLGLGLLVVPELDDLTVGAPFSFSFLRASYSSHWWSLCWLRH